MAFPLSPARSLLLAFTLLLASCNDGASPPAAGTGSSGVPVATTPAYWPTSGWQTATPEAQGFSTGALDALAADAATSLPYHTSLLVIRNGWLVHESYHDTPSQTSGVDTQHHVWSVTKSVTSLTLARAASRGDITSIDVTAGDVFPAAAFGALPADDPRRAITLRHALQMRSGLAWNEPAWLLTLRDPMLRLALGEFPDCSPSDDNRILCGVLHQDLAYTPGTVWNYNTYDSYLVSGFFRNLTGLRLDEYANQHLFTPLGIVDPPTWTGLPAAYTFGGGLLRIRSRDLAKLGLLVQYNGQWEGTQLIDPAVLDLTLAPQGPGLVAAFDAGTGQPSGTVGTDIAYGLQWWRATGPAMGGLASISARGLGGQMLHIFRDKGLIVLITCDDDITSDRETEINAFLKTHIVDRLLP
ncbi:MAG: beta-lactamase family protein [Moraxellaceae bacterium]|jgi:CubicO group peptidase (beta-lactamase class C family)|nr:beta-lactamase family protein [Moraxellaceae bacterium]